MKRALASALMLTACTLAPTALADVAVVMEKPNTVSGGSFSAFDYIPETDEFRTAGYLSGHDLRWSEVLDDSVYPWTIDGGQLLTNFQLEIFARDGYAGNRSSFNFWGMNYCPADGSFFLLPIASLRGPVSSVRLDAERDTIKHFPGFPDSPQVAPSHCSVTNVGGVYKLIDDNLSAGNGFVTAGVQPGHRLTMYPVSWLAEIYAKTYTITEVIDEKTLRLDQDPIFSGDTVENEVGYILSVQPHVTLATFRQNIPYYVANTTSGPKAHYKGGMTADGSTLYLADTVSDNIIAVDTQTPGQFTIFTSEATLIDYVQAQVNAGRHNAIVNPYRIYTDDITTYHVDADWNNASTDTTIDWASTEQVAVGDESAKVTFNSAAAEFAIRSDDGGALDPVGFEAVDFWIHGGATGGQQMELWLMNSNGVGSGITLTPPQAGTWTHVVAPLSLFTVADNLYWVIFKNTAGAAQSPFYIDELVLNWTDPMPAWAGAFDPDAASAGGGQIAIDPNGRLFFTESETDDIVWTDDGVALHTYLPSSDIAAAYVAYGAIDPYHYEASNAVQPLGMAFDPMGTLYWGENQTKSIWKAPAGKPTHVIPLATTAQLIEGMALPGEPTPRGLNCFAIRGMELLTFNFVDGDFMYKVDLNTYEFGDFDADFDVDLDDYDFFVDCIAGPGVTQWPANCTSVGFQMADLDNDGDVDMKDFADFALYFVPGPPPLPGDMDQDGDVDLDDYAWFADCLAGPEVTVPPVSCPVGFEDADLDADGDVDLRDFALFSFALP